MLKVMLIGHIASCTQIKVSALGAFPAHALNTLGAARVTDDVGMSNT